MHTYIYAYVKVLVAQSCPTLLDPMDCSPPGSLSRGFSKLEYRSGLPCPTPGDLHDLGIKPASAALADGHFTTQPPRRLVPYSRFSLRIKSLDQTSAQKRKKSRMLRLNLYKTLNVDIIQRRHANFSILLVFVRKFGFNNELKTDLTLLFSKVYYDLWK